jgi:hypothetical protein
VPSALAFTLVAAFGALLAIGSWAVLRWAAADPALARRLAGPREVRVGSLLEGGDLPQRPVRVAGRVRCRDPLQTPDGDRLVAFHRDVEVLADGRWRSVERIRESRSFALWDHDGSITLDPSRAAEPLVALPKVWRGDPSALEEPHASAIRRLVERHGRVAAARSIVRTLDVTDRLLVVAQPRRADDGRVRLDPPPGGFVITNLALADAMRLLGGRHRRAAAMGVAGVGLGVAVLVLGIVGAAVAALF